MAYQVLARKYRPQCFADVAGQDHVTRTLRNALAQHRIAHGYIFSGHRGIGKTTIARILAMALNCRTEIGATGSDGTAVRPTPEPCGTCESCTEVRAGNAVDVIEIDAATNRGIDEIRELRDAARYRPARDRYKIYILDEAHQITDAAFNALLKTLEEPPDHVVFMMATTQPEDIPQTIRSRCQHFSFHAVKFDDILLQLRTIAIEEKIAADEEALALLAEAGDGSMRDALSIMDQAIASAPLVSGSAGELAQPKLEAGQIRELMGTVPNTVFERLLEAIGENQSGPVIEEVNRLLNAGNSASQLARQFVRYLRNVLMARIAGERTELLQLSPDERARAGRSALLFSEEDLTRFLQVMLRTFDDLNYRQEPRFHLELGLLKLVHLQRLLPVEQLLSQLGTATGRAGGSPVSGGRSSGLERGMDVRTAASLQPSAPKQPVAPGQQAAQVQTRPPTQPPPPPIDGGALPAARKEPAQSESDAPAIFSPFESDRRRKTGEPNSAPAAVEAGRRDLKQQQPVVTSMPAAAPLPGGVSAVQPNLTPELDSSRKATGEAIVAPAASESPSGHPEDPIAPVETAARPPASLAATSLTPLTFDTESAPDAARAVSQEADESAPVLGSLEAIEPAATSAAGAVELARERICQALDQAGHNTAAALLGNGSWVEQDGGLTVTVAAKKTMLGLAMNTDAEKICRETLRTLAEGGRPRLLTVLPGEAGAAPAQRRAPVAQASGSVQARALDHPLVQQAQTLFNAEVRSVVDLRNK